MFGLNSLNIEVRGVIRDDQQEVLWVRVCGFIWNDHPKILNQGGENQTDNKLSTFILLFLGNTCTIKNHTWN
ncbi:hypothetical protein AC812_02545 [Bellilinea caldifistulae]|uniref:Uncharacterized protein n=1 Tax=Bellilinea caldifistulae TaxID=360411 RepID=A0A0N8GNC9_9CHLR|nr:hypothetical protein AC812_02545 [Bellilinea caldifistulae]